ncbi:MAG: carotenoid cleavage dioxygenase-like enzyme, partial [Myxococcota bacterium]
KDTANTDVVVHRGEALALWYVAGTPYRVDLDTLETLGAARFGSDRRFSVSAHAKVDPVTDELMFFDYGRQAPYMHYGVVGADGLLKQLEPITLPGPRLPHDMAFTERYSVLMDLPVVPDAEAAKKGRWVIRYAQTQPARFAILPRHGGDADVRWFEAAPCYIYHVVNAWEEGDTVVMVGCRTTDPIPASDPRDGDPLTARMMANLRLKAQLHEWRFDLATGQTTERALDDRFAEFPTIDGRRAGRRTRLGYAMLTADVSTLAFEGIVAYDLDDGAAKTTQFGPGWYGNEVGFAPRVGGSGEEGDGYLVTFVSHPDAGSRCLVYDAQDVTAGPRVTLSLPTRVPTGFHACWAPL